MTDDTLLHQIIQGLTTVLQSSPYEDARASAANTIECIVEWTRSPANKLARVYHTPHDDDPNEFLHQIIGGLEDVLKCSPYQTSRAFASKTILYIIEDKLKGEH